MLCLSILYNMSQLSVHLNIGLVCLNTLGLACYLYSRV